MAIGAGASGLNARQDYSCGYVRAIGALVASFSLPPRLSCVPIVDNTGVVALLISLTDSRTGNIERWC